MELIQKVLSPSGLKDFPEEEWTDDFRAMMERELEDLSNHD